MPLVTSNLHKKGLDYPKEPILLVICPLIYFIELHIHELVSYGVYAYTIDLGDNQLIEASLYAFVFTWFGLDRLWF